MNNNKYKILVVEDEAHVRSLFQTILENNGYAVLLAETCTQGSMMFSSHVPDLVILDLGLPDGDGLDFIREVRTCSSVPVVVVSARTTEQDKVTALDLGANDYMTKPFGTEELMARVRAALRNRVAAADLGIDRVYRVRDMEIDCSRRSVTIGGEEVKLTQTEFNILMFLAQHRGRLLTYYSIIQQVWGSIDDGSIKKLQVNMANIRRKLGIRPGDNSYIINELGIGYRIADDVL